MPTSTKVAVYSRLSQDREGDKASIARQEADCAALASSRGWIVAETFRDRDRSAYSGVKRPAFARMLEGVEAGEFSGVVAWKVDRLGRRAADVVNLVDRMRGVDGFLATCDGLDSSTTVGAAVVSIGGILAQMESDNISSRTRRAKLQAAQQGFPTGGGRRPYGYKVGGMELEPSEAERIVGAAAAVLEGRTLRSIAMAWSTAGVLTSEGRPWNATALKRTLVAPRIAGLREYQGEVIGPAAWPAIVTADEHERLVSILKNPARRTSAPKARRYLLTGLASCGKCEGPMVGKPTATHRRTYVCRSQTRGEGCRGVRIGADYLDALIGEAVLLRLDSPAFHKARRAMKGEGTSAKLVQSLAEDEGRLDQLSDDYYVNKTMTRKRFLRAQEALEARITEARDKLAVESSLTIVATLNGDLRAEWAGQDDAWRRAVVGAIVERITIAYIGRGQRSTSDRVDVVWSV